MRQAAIDMIDLSEVVFFQFKSNHVRCFDFKDSPYICEK